MESHKVHDPLMERQPIKHNLTSAAPAQICKWPAGDWVTAHKMAAPVLPGEKSPADAVKTTFVEGIRHHLGKYSFVQLLLHSITAADPFTFCFWLWFPRYSFRNLNFRVCQIRKLFTASPPNYNSRRPIGDKSRILIGRQYERPNAEWFRYCQNKTLTRVYHGRVLCQLSNWHRRYAIPDKKTESAYMGCTEILPFHDRRNTWHT